MTTRATVVFDKPYGQKGTEGGSRRPMTARTEFRGKGVWTALGHRLDARVVSRLSRDGASADDTAPGRNIGPTPTTIEVPLELNCEVPDGCAVIIDSGVWLSLRADTPPASTRTVRNLVAVIPRHILEETEETAAPGRAEPHPAAEVKAK